MPAVFGVDLAKRIFQIHTVDVHSGEIRRWTLSRSRLTEFFGDMAPAIIAMEACGSSHHWARRFSAMGHDVRMIATKFVRPFVKTNKTDAADAAAIWEAAQRPGMRFVPVKTEHQQGILAILFFSLAGLRTSAREHSCFWRGPAPTFDSGAGSRYL